MNLKTRLEKRRARIDRRLDCLLPAAITPPETIHRAMRYAVLGGGKRIRPILCLEAAAALGERSAAVEELACAIEFIHTYSLIHDDLPALDNDDLRRGRPTCHRKFGEAMAILAGDALLTLAFEVLGRMRRPGPSQRIEIVRELAAAAGTRGGMIAGQVADLEAEGKKVSAQRVVTIHRAKTGALIRASVRSAALYAGARGGSLQRLSRYGEKLGLAFQIVDDILDVRSTSRHLGKRAHKDAGQRKATYPSVHGVEKSERVAARLVEEACGELKGFGPRARPLQEIARYIFQRTS